MILGKHMVNLNCVIFFFATELDRKLEGKNVFVNCVHPGVVATELTRNLGDLYGSIGVGIGAVGSAIFSKSVETGALTSLYVASSPKIETDSIRGQYFVPTAKLSEASAHGRDAELAAKLWTLSEEMIAKVFSGDNKDSDDHHHHHEEGEGDNEN